MALPGLNLIGVLLIGTSIFDAIKYSIQARKVQRLHSAKQISRRFINFALINDIVKLWYGISIIDWYIIVSSILALICMIDLWWQVYLFYPYKMRGCTNFKRPNLMLYLVNSLLPNRIRRRL